MSYSNPFGAPPMAPFAPAPSGSSPFSGPPSYASAPVGSPAYDALPYHPVWHPQQVGLAPVTETPKNQIFGQYTTRIVVIGVLVAVAAAAVIYQQRKK